MCGIAGFLTDGSSANPALLKRMCDRLVHRGPDDEGYHIQGPLGLGFRRLSIIDVSGGHQPLSNEDGTVTVAFNGEIYNYLELRKGLVERGHRFATSSDTEVLVHLYEEVGERLPEYLNGMFAFAIADSRTGELFLARDRTGKKPLYYSTSVPSLRLCFASELKALVALPDFPGQVNASSVADFLALSYVPEWATIYTGASKLPPGHSLTVGRGGLRLRRYWRACFEERSRNVAGAIEELQSLAQDAVKRRMISDVPLGAFLSGGVDSSAVVGMMAEQSSLPVKTFSIGFTSKAFDELEYARLAARMHGTEHHEEVVSPSIHDVLDELCHQFDEPFGDSSAIPTLSLARMTRRHVTVALSGDGADEVFGGYRRYRFGVLEERIREKFPEVWRICRSKLATPISIRCPPSGTRGWSRFSLPNLGGLCPDIRHGKGFASCFRASGIYRRWPRCRRWILRLICRAISWSRRTGLRWPIRWRLVRLGWTTA
jgi:asparagine synthase (glutamine-hydrolysing)